jgi:hypothetical protein
MDNSVVKDRREQFFSQLNLSESVARNYKNALNSTFVKVVLAERSNKESLFRITGTDTVLKTKLLQESQGQILDSLKESPIQKECDALK